MNSELLRIIGIPQNHWDARLKLIPDNCSHKKTLITYCENIISNVQAGQGLYIWGDYSMGKSAAASICLKAAARSRIFGRWVRAKELPGIQIENHLMPESGELLFEDLRNTSLLVIDEFQLRKEVKYTESLVEDVVRYRIDRQLPTIMTSNVVLTDLKLRYPAMYAVLQESLYPVRFQGHDFRKSFGGKVSGLDT